MISTTKSNISFCATKRSLLPHHAAAPDQSPYSFFFSSLLEKTKGISTDFPYIYNFHWPINGLVQEYLNERGGGGKCISEETNDHKRKVSRYSRTPNIAFFVLHQFVGYVRSQTGLCYPQCTSYIANSLLSIQCMLGSMVVYKYLKITHLRGELIMKQNDICSTNLNIP